MNSERNRILDMVAAGKLSAEEADRLLESMDRKSETATCPFCAEEIPASAGTCPECGSRLGQTVSEQYERSFGSLGGMSKFLIIYMFFVCIIVLLFSFNSLFNIGPWVFPDLLALFGLCAAILMCRGKREGWIMGMIWSAAQIIVIIIGSSAVNRQFLHLGVYSTVNGSGLGFNLVGVLLVIFFVTARKDWEQI